MSCELVLCKNHYQHSSEHKSVDEHEFKTVKIKKIYTALDYSISTNSVNVVVVKSKVTCCEEFHCQWQYTCALKFVKYIGDREFIVRDLLGAHYIYSCKDVIAYK